MHNALIPKAKREDIIAVDQFSKEANRELATARAAGDQFSLALTTARAIQGLRELITPAMMEDVMQLMNSQLGFATDRDPSRPTKRDPNPQPYPVEIVKDCFITAQLWGASPVGNEWNIISQRAYKTVQFYRRKVREQPGVRDVFVQIGSPQYADEGSKARVPCAASWTQDGKSRKRACLQDASGDWRVSVKVNYGMGEDAIKGKAERKLLALVLADMEGRPVDDTDAIDPDDPHTIINGEFTVTTDPATPAPDETQADPHPGDDIAQDAEQHVHEQTPAPKPDNPASTKPREWWIEQLSKKPTSKAAAAWVQFAHESGVDIAKEGDELILKLRSKRDSKAA